MKWWKRWRAQRRTRADMAVYGLLATRTYYADDDGMTVPEIQRQLGGRFVGLYVTLARLHDDELIVGGWSAAGRPRRMLYRAVTKAGTS